ncbi:hypothetical protein [Histophilus somni]|uniref:hypothetical protein n=1 Tax=Histophilus somni TaxID=731 RepID=UPI00109CDBD7|nr:hypothetical protein [Histophilus somni]MBB5151812.1 hypothetical protein [Histophilus somni]QEH20947.1 hypothetical protein FWK55_01470 [Histophilus somni]THA44453.1 hypothetical protein E5429_05970 [Histophilus somni]
MNNQPLAHPNQALCGNNSLTIDYLSQVQKCIKRLDKMGLHVINVHFEHIKPKVRVQPCAITQMLQKNKQAICYIRGNDPQRYSEYQMLVEGIKVIWRTHLH